VISTVLTFTPDRTLLTLPRGCHQLQAPRHEACRRRLV